MIAGARTMVAVVAPIGVAVSPPQTISSVAGTTSLMRSLPFVLSEAGCPSRMPVIVVASQSAAWTTPVG